MGVAAPPRPGRHGRGGPASTGGQPHGGGVAVSMALVDRAWCVVVPHHARGARQARQRLATELTGVIRARLLTDVIAVAAELVGNAVRHASPLPGGVVRVAWRLRRSHRGDDTIEVRVTDGGADARPRVRIRGPAPVD